MTPRSVSTALALAAAALLCCAHPARAQYNTGAPPEVRDLDILEKPGSTLPFSARLTDENGTAVLLGDYFGTGPRATGKPVILSLAYYDCPVACPMMFANMLKCFNALDYDIGDDFTVLTVSFDPTNSTAQAAQWKRTAVSGYARPGADAGWHIHTTSEADARAIADAVGFQYRYFPNTGEYAHPSGIFVCTPDGRLSRALYGAGWEPRQVKLALLDASDGRIAQSFGDHLLQWCYRWDPASGSYSASAFFLMQIVGAVTAIGIASLVIALRLGERARAARANTHTVHHA